MVNNSVDLEKMAVHERWSCEICGERSLEWRLVTGHCECTRCRAEYTLRDGEYWLNVPKLNIRDEFIEACKLLWKMHRAPLTTYSREDWAQVFSELGRLEVWEQALAQIDLGTYGG